ncbi:shikimate kinase [Kribbella capetownensis]|uniref:Shikimate kinase n=1 Tax=Kribbella capetownensis TaxID=1572659 RepID=A0A4R0JGB5_9ACTN|nr:AAA family ATPase [Kribbella capetownensis]TCC45207.1 shikimate kinase [Kribbella capetownensis]
MKRILVTGVSGVGKSTVVARLAELGHHAVDLDSPEWSEWVDSADGSGPTPSQSGKDWQWREDRVRKLLADDSDGVLFVSGCAANMGIFRDRFTGVVLLSIPAELMAERLTHRTTNAYGKDPAELARSLDFKDSVEPLLRATADLELDGTEPLAQLVSRIERFAADL